MRSDALDIRPDSKMMSAQIAAFDWSSTPLGPIDGWTQPLRTLVDVMLSGIQPMCIVWGPERTLLYNDRYAHLIADAHPALGRDFLDVWNERRADLTRLIKRVARGDRLSAQDIEFVSQGKHDGAVEHWSHTFAPVRDGDGHLLGLLGSCHDVTTYVQLDRRHTFLRGLNDALHSLDDPFRIMSTAVEHLGRYLNADRVGFGEVQPDDATVVLHTCYANRVQPLHGAFPLDSFGPQHIAEQRQGLTRWSEDVVREPDQNHAVWASIDARSFASVPLIRNGRFAASLYVNFREPHHWTSDEITVIEEVASRTWSAVERARAEAIAKQQQDETLRTAAALDALVRNAPIGFAFLDRDHRYALINQKLAEINGIPADAHLGCTLEELLPVNAKTVGPILDQVFDTGQVRPQVEVSGETPAHPDQLRTWMTNYFPVMGLDGDVTQVGVTVIDITERKYAEEALLASEARFRGVFESGALGFAIFDLNTGETLAINDRLLAMTGHSRADFEQGRWHWRDITPPEHLHRDAAATLEAREKGFWEPFEKEHLHKDGRRIPVRVSSAPLPGEEGRVVCVVDDLTTVKAAEAQLREREERLRLATEHAEVGFWDVDEVNQVLHWPPLVKAMFGISADKPVSMEDFYSGLHPEDRDAASAAYAAAADPRQRALYDVEYRTVGKEDGVIRWVAAKGRGVFDSTGRCLRVVGTALDITPRKKAEAALRELNETLERRVAERTAELETTNQHFRAIFNTSFQLTGLIDTSGTILVVNQSALDTAKAKAEDIVGLKLWDSPWWASTGTERDKLQEAIRRVAGGEFVRYETTHRGRTFDFSLKPMANKDGAPSGIVAEAREITQQRRAEEALRQSQKMEAVGQLTGGIAHDFNNLLQGVAGSLDLIRRKSSDPQRVQRWAEAGLAAAERGAKLTSQLLAFSRSQKMEVKPVALSHLVTGFRDMLERTIGPHIKVHVDLKTDGIQVLGDEVQIEMAVLNLALNARDAMPDGGDLTIKTRPIQLRGDVDLPDGDYVELSVRDTGAGMAPEVVARAFDPFFTTKGVGKGTGLGLSQVYGAMRQAGGAVRIESGVGEGTTIRLLLRQTDDRAAASAADEGEAPGANATAKILIVDDDPDVRGFLAESLDALGFDVVVADGGKTALAELQRSAPDAMVIDFAMPDMNGAEVARLARAYHPGLPIIFATGFAESAALDAVAGSEMPVLRKPFRIQDLQSALTLVLGA